MSVETAPNGEHNGEHLPRPRNSMGAVARGEKLAPPSGRRPGRGAVGVTLAVDPEIVGGQFARALDAIVCRCVHTTAEVRPCRECAGRLDRAEVRRLGRALFARSGIPIGHCEVAEEKYAEVGWLLEQVERLASGTMPRN